MAQHDEWLAARLARLRRLQEDIDRDLDDQARREAEELRARQEAERREDAEWNRLHEQRLRAHASSSKQARRDLANAEKAIRRIEKRRSLRGPKGDRRAVLVLAIVIFLFVELTLTLDHYTGFDIKDAHRLGQATVQTCHRVGPVGYGFGYWDECSAQVNWDDGTTENTVSAEAGFFDHSELGTTVTIGDLGEARSGRRLAREERPYRLPVKVLAIGTTVISVLLGLLLMNMVRLMFGIRRANIRNAE